MPSEELLQDEDVSVEHGQATADRKTLGEEPEPDQHPLAATYRRLVPDLGKIKVPSSVSSSSRTGLSIVSGLILAAYAAVLVGFVSLGLLLLVKAIFTAGILSLALGLLSLLILFSGVAGLRPLLPRIDPIAVELPLDKSDQRALRALCSFLATKHKIAIEPSLKLSCQSHHGLEQFRRFQRLISPAKIPNAHSSDMADITANADKDRHLSGSENQSEVKTLPHLTISYLALKSLSGRQNLGELAGELGKMRFAGRRRAFIQALAFQFEDAQREELGYRNWLNEFESKTGKLVYKLVFFPVNFGIKLGGWINKPFYKAALFLEHRVARGEREFVERCKLACTGAQEYSASYFRRAYGEWASAQVASELFADPKHYLCVKSVFTLIDSKAKQLQENQQIAIQDELLLSTQEGDFLGVRERIMAAEELDPNVPNAARFSLDFLIQDRVELEENLTRLFYLEHDRQYDDSRLVDPAEVAVALKGERANDELRERYYNQWYERTHVWRFDEAEAIEAIPSLGAKREKLNEVVKAIRHHTFDYERVKRDLPDLHKRIAAYRFILGIQKAGYVIKDESILGIPNDQIRSVPENYSTLNKEFEGASAKRIRLSCLVANRLMLGISLALEDEDQLHGVYLLNLMQTFDELAQQVDGLKMRMELLPLYLKRIEAFDELKHKSEIARLIRRVEFVVGNIIDETSAMRYRYSEKYEFLADSLMQYLDNGWNFSANSAQDVIDQYWKLCEGFAATNDEISAEAARLAMKAEHILGIEKARLV